MLSSIAIELREEQYRCAVTLLCFFNEWDVACNFDFTDVITLPSFGYLNQ